MTHLGFARSGLFVDANPRPVNCCLCKFRGSTKLTCSVLLFSARLQSRCPRSTIWPPLPSKNSNARNLRYEVLPLHSAVRNTADFVRNQPTNWNFSHHIGSFNTVLEISRPGCWQHFTTMQTDAMNASDNYSTSHQDVCPVEDNDSVDSGDGLGLKEGSQVGKTKQHEASVQVDSSLLRFIVGTGGATKAKIESDNQVELQIPPKSNSSNFDSNIIVRGGTEDAVNQAVKQIEEVVEQAVRSPNYQYTHFISLPLALHGSLVSELASFEEAVLSSVESCDEDVTGGCGNGELEDSGNGSGKTALVDTSQRYCANDTNNVPNVGGVPSNQTEDGQEPSREPLIGRTRQKQDLGIDKSILVKAKTFHLTVLMLKLWNQSRISAAADILQKCREAVHLALENRPVEIELNGVDCMRSNPAKAHVLYARVQEVNQGGRLVAACQVLIDAFITGGLVMERDQKHSLMLHATLMNTSHRKRSKGRNSSRRKPFDATQIIEAYGSKRWGTYLITEAHLSQRFLYDEDGYYHCCSVIPFPSI